MTYGRKIDIDRLVDALNRANPATRTHVLALLAEAFPEVLWTVGPAGRADAAIIVEDYRP